MPRLQLTRTEKTPDIHFDTEAGLFEMKGCSIHENAEAFFRPLLDLVEAYASRPEAVTLVRLDLDYFNSSSSKYILDLLRQIDVACGAGLTKATVEWHYAQDDLDMLEAGQDYEELLDMPVSFVSHPTAR